MNEKETLEKISMMSPAELENINHLIQTNQVLSIPENLNPYKMTNLVFIIIGGNLINVNTIGQVTRKGGVVFIVNQTHTRQQEFHIGSEENAKRVFDKIQHLITVNGNVWDLDK